ncbi:hypothetical protein PISMIDRAFT_16359, partial [Pisolithus microcarpus 441]
MENYVFTFPPVSFDSSSDFTCPVPQTLTSYDYWNPSQALFPPNAVQLAPEPLTVLHASDGYPVLDLALLAISLPQPKLSLTSEMPSTSKLTPLNATSEPAATILSTCPNSGVPGGCNGEIIMAKPAGNKSTWAAQNPGWPITQPCQPLTTMEKEHHSAHAASRQISAAQWKDCNTLLNKAIQKLSDEFEAKVQVVATTHNVTQEKVKKLLGGHKYYRNLCGMQLANAIIHDKAHEVNE